MFFHRIKLVFKLPSLQVILGTALSVGLLVLSVWLLGTSIRQASGLVTGLIILMFLLSYITPAIVLILVLYRSFQNRSNRVGQLGIILLSYFSMIVVFTGLYFSMAFVGDYDYAADHYFYYHSAGQDFEIGRIKRLNPYSNDDRAFTGIEKHLFGTVDDYIPRGIYRDLEDIERYRARSAAQLEFEGVVEFKRSSVQPVLLDCLHLSVATITTVGYGNIAPRTWYAKMATNIEALTGTILLVVALGMLFSGVRT